MDAEEEKWMLCSTCLLLVRSSKSHFLQSAHQCFLVPREGMLNLVCLDCKATFRYLSEAEMHMRNNREHTKLQETHMDDDTEVFVSVFKKDIPKFKKLGLELKEATSVSCLDGNDRSDCSVDVITDSMKDVNLNARDRLVTEGLKLRARRTLKHLNISDDQIAMLHEMYVLAEDIERDDAIKKINQVLEECEQTKGLLKFSLTNVNTKNNDYVYEKQLQQICLKKSTFICTTKNPQQVNEANRLHKMLMEFRQLLTDDKQLRIHEIPYTYSNIYEGQDQSDYDLKDISAMLGITRESLNIYTLPTGSIRGPILLYIGERIMTDCSLGGSSGCKIPTEAHKVTGVQSRKPINFILVVEKDTLFQALSDRRFHEKHNCVVITGGGQPSVCTRILLRKLADMLHVPVYGLFDADPSGAQIYSVYKYGSEGRAFEGICLTTPGMEWLGLFPDEVKKRFRDTMARNDPEKKEPADPRMTILANLISKPHIRDDPLLYHKLSKMELQREVAESDILTRYYDLEEYILNKIEKAKAKEQQLQ